MKCGNQSETLPHVLCHCGPHADSYDITGLSRDLPQLPGNLVNQRIRGVNEDFAVLRGDLVVRHKPSRTVVIVDAAVTFENIFKARKKAGQEKIMRNQLPAISLFSRGCIVHPCLAVDTHIMIASSPN